MTNHRTEAPSFSTMQCWLLLPVAIFGGVVSLMSITGWVFSIPIFLYHSPEVHPMSFPGAINLFIGSFAGGSLVLGYRQLTHRLFLIIIILASIYIILNLLQINWGFAENFFYHESSDIQISAFRTSTNALFSGLFISIAFYLLSSRVLTAAKLLFASIFAILSLAVTLSAMYGFFTHTNQIYVWFAVTDMSIITASVETVYGLGCIYIASYFVQSLYPRVSAIWFPVIGTITCIVLLTALIVSIGRHQEVEQQSTLESGQLLIGINLVITFVSIVLIAFIAWMLYIFQKIKIVNTELEETISEKTLFLANMSHEIRSPLQAVLGTISLLTQQDLNPKQEKIVGNLSDASHQLLSVINNVIDLTKLEAGLYTFPKGPSDVKKIAEEQIRIFSPLAEKHNIKLHLQLTPIDPPPVMIGSTVQQPIFTNLISNAIKYTNEGSITVKVDLEKRDQSHGNLHIQVSDTGVGIPKDKIPELFQKFSQFEQNLPTKQPKGSGLGLYIIKLIVESMKGRITVQSEVGKGSTFKVMIPVEFAHEQ